jgi:hypothetical protein
MGGAGGGSARGTAGARLGLAGLRGAADPQIRNPQRRRQPAFGRYALRVAFGDKQTAAQLRKLQESAVEYHNEELARSRDQAKEAKKEGDDYGAAALEFAIGYHKAALAWLKNVPAK